MSNRVRELEQRLERTEQELRLFQKISRMMVRDMSLQDVMRSVVALVTEFTACDSCLVYLIDDSDGQSLRLCASNNADDPAVGQLSMGLSEGLTGWVARERRLLAISREAYLDPRFKLFRDLPEDTFEAFLSAPIVFRGRVIGVINVQHRAAHQHSGDEMELLTTVGEQVGCVLTLARLAAETRTSSTDAELVLASMRQ